MALSPEELEQIRAMVRSEVSKSRVNPWWPLWSTLGALFLVFVAVLALHVVVIAGFTIYHLMAH